MEHEDTSANDERYVRVADLITFLKTFYVEEDDRHSWRDHTNDCIDRILSKIDRLSIKENES